MIRSEPSQLESLMREMFLRCGASEEEASLVADHLVTSNLTGHDSHGVIRAPWYIEKIEKGEITPGAPIEVERETPTSAIVNGNWGFGQVVARFAMNLAIKKAKQQTVACVTVRQCNHIGRLGAYTSLASKAGMVGIAMANLHGTSHCVAPFGGRDRRLPTNPISIAFPTGHDPSFLLDMSTSVVAEGKIKLKLQQEESLPEGWTVDAEGHPSQVPSRFYEEPRGALLPLGGISGYKGFGLALAVDALSGTLSGATCSNPKSKRHGNACFFLAIRIESFTPFNKFISQVDDLVRHVKSSRLSPGAEEILMPGELEYVSLNRGKKTGLHLDEKTWEALQRKAKELGIEPCLR